MKFIGTTLGCTHIGKKPMEKRSLTEGKTVVTTSGLLRALQGKGIEDIAEIRYTNRKALVKDFSAGVEN